jgi:hypothetical protein
VAAQSAHRTPHNAAGRGQRGPPLPCATDRDFARRVPMASTSHADAPLDSSPSARACPRSRSRPVGLAAAAADRRGDTPPAVTSAAEVRPVRLQPAAGASRYRAVSARAPAAAFPLLSPSHAPTFPLSRRAPSGRRRNTGVRLDAKTVTCCVECQIGPVGDAWGIRSSQRIRKRDIRAACPPGERPRLTRASVCASRHSRI